MWHLQCCKNMTHWAAGPWPPVNRIVIVCLPPPQREADLQQTVVSALARSPQSSQPHMPRAKRRQGTRAVQRRSRITGREGGRLQHVWVCPYQWCWKGLKKHSTESLCGFEMVKWEEFRLYNSYIKQWRVFSSYRCCQSCAGYTTLLHICEVTLPRFKLTCVGWQMKDRLKWQVKKNSTAVCWNESLDICACGSFWIFVLFD